MPTPTRNRPGITRTGVVHDDGTTITVAGWGLALCAARCRCHAHPVTGQLLIAQSHTGSLGLRSFTTSDRRCDCCTPWTVDELTDIVAFLDQVAALPEHA